MKNFRTTIFFSNKDNVYSETQRFITHSSIVVSLFIFLYCLPYNYLVRSGFLKTFDLPTERINLLHFVLLLAFTFSYGMLIFFFKKLKEKEINMGAILVFIFTIAATYFIGFLWVKTFVNKAQKTYLGGNAVCTGALNNLQESFILN